MVKLYEYFTVNISGDSNFFNIINLKNTSPDLIKIISYSYFENGHNGDIFNVSCDLFSHPLSGIISDVAYINPNANFINCNLKYNNYKRNLAGQHYINITHYPIGGNVTTGGVNGVLILLLQFITNE